MNKKHILITCLLGALLGCSTPPPRHTENICKMFSAYPHWYWAAERSSRRWGIPVSIQMAIINQESGFHSDIQPARTKLLWIIPWRRPSSAYGYSQALNGSWKEYKRLRGRRFASRSNFKDAVDFIGWMLHRVHQRTHIPMSRPYRLYLAYHEGGGGYLRKTYRHKPKLMRIARKVAIRAKRYHTQLMHCKNHLPKKRWWNFS